MARKELMSSVLDLRGLDMVTPVDLISNGHTPYSKNFRLYAQQSDDRQVAVSSRKGPGYYTKQLRETLLDSLSDVTGGSLVDVGAILGVHAIQFTASRTERLTAVELNVSNDGGAAGPLMVGVYTDDSGKPGRLLAESSIQSGDIGKTPKYLPARFIQAPALNANSKYWVVINIQDDGKGFYKLSATTAGSGAYKTDSALSQLQHQPYSLNYKIYSAPSETDKGAYRFARDNGQNTTLVAYGTSMYRIDEASGNLVEIISGLSPHANEYRFTNGDNKVFWVNGHDQLTAWDGTIEANVQNTVPNPSFEVNTGGYTATAGSAIARSVSDYKSAPASLLVSAAGGQRGVSLAMMLFKDRRYKMSYWVKGSSASGNIFLTVNNNSAVLQGTSRPVPGAWTKMEFYFTPTADVTTVDFKADSTNFYIDDISIIDTGIEYITDPELPILSDIIMHKDRLWGVVASDPNKLVFSENPGNPAYDPTGKIPTTSREQWYYAWLSVSYWYVPRPHNGSPITSLVSFQDTLVVFTQDNKYILSGYDRGSFSLRQSTGNKGAISRRGVVYDENSIYFVSDDGFYLYNGSSDQKLSTLINPLFDGCNQKAKITPVIWKNQVRFYMSSSGSADNDLCVVFDKDLKELMLDTDTWVNRALYYSDADDDHQLAEFSSLTATVYLAEKHYHSLGAPIDFEYRLKYDSMKSPMQRKRIRRFYPILQGVDNTFKISLAMDKDFEDSPKVKEQLLTTNGAKWGEFKWGDDTIYGGSKSFKPKRQSYSGYAYYWQLRVSRRGVNNRVAFVGAQYSYKSKRL